MSNPQTYTVRKYDTDKVRYRSKINLVEIGIYSTRWRVQRIPYMRKRKIHKISNGYYHIRLRYR